MYNVDPVTGRIESDARTKPKPPQYGDVVRPDGTVILKVCYINEHTGLIERYLLDGDGKPMLNATKTEALTFKEIVPGVRFVPKGETLPSDADVPFMVG